MPPTKMKYEKEILEIMPLVRACLDSAYADSTQWALADKAHFWFHHRKPRLTQKTIEWIMDQAWKRLAKNQQN